MAEIEHSVGQITPLLNTNLFFLLYDLVIPMKRRSLIGSLSSMNFAIKFIQAAKMDKLLLQSIPEN